MRKLRPEYYSDSADRPLYLLDEATLGYALDTITDQNRTHEFEIFCRKLCEQAICPNLRPQTGPDGGGDSKADTETYPVANEIAELFYVGQPMGGTERWGFGFSAQKTWAAKARSDVEGLLETSRPYDRIICLTSRFAKAKNRAKLEHELTQAHGVPVTIHDRTWIIEEVIAKERKGLAYEYLNVGTIAKDGRLGPEDYSRTRRLAELDDAIGDPEAYSSMETQRVTDALLTAKLARNLERQRHEIDGRFLRAIRLADKYGTFRQRLETRYEHLWSAFWWFDDVEQLNSSYDAFEALAIRAEHTANLQFLANLNQCLVNSVLHRLLTADEADLEARTGRLVSVLEVFAKDDGRPNNQLEARTLLALNQLNRAALAHHTSGLSEIWAEFSSIVEQARGLGEYDADRLEKLIDVAGNGWGDDPDYGALVDKLAAFVAERKSEAEGALVLLKRAKKLGKSNRLEAIRLFGNAAAGLTKQEYVHALIGASIPLAAAYYSAGLLWAARSAFVFAASTIVAEGERDSRIDPTFIVALGGLAETCLYLGHLSDVLFAIQLLHGAISMIPLKDEDKTRFEDQLRTMDFKLAARLLNSEVDELAGLSQLPDVLERFDLEVSRCALLYALGYEDRLWQDGSLPAGETRESVRSLYERLMGQPAGENRGPLVINERGLQTRLGKILGMTVRLTHDGTDTSVMVADMVLATLDVFFATTIEMRIMPHTEQVRLRLDEEADLAEPVVEMDPKGLDGRIRWPLGRSPHELGREQKVSRFMIEVAGAVMETTCIVTEVENTIQRLFKDDGVHNRIMLAMAAGTSYHRLTSRWLTRLSGWTDDSDVDTYELRLDRPVLVPDAMKSDALEEASADGDTTHWPENHLAMEVRSVIDVHAWDQADWAGTGFMNFDPAYPPCLGLIFSDSDAGRRIFERWRERFGDVDEKEEIRLSIIRGVSETNPTHYSVMITSNPEAGSFSGKSVLTATRSKTMTPDTSLNLDVFLESYRKIGGFYLMPFLMEDGQPVYPMNLSIIKRQLVVRDAKDVGEHDIDSIALAAALAPVRGADEG